MTDIYLHIDARMADYIRTHPQFQMSGHYYAQTTEFLQSMFCARVLRFALQTMHAWYFP